MTVRGLNALNNQLTQLLAVKALLEEFETVPPLTRVQRLIQMFERSMKSGLDLSSVWTAVRTAGLTAVASHETTLRAALADAATEIVEDNT